VGETDQGARGARLLDMEIMTDDSGYITLYACMRGHGVALSDEVEVQIGAWLVVPSDAVQ
jgi:hypothetical protein